MIDLGVATSIAIDNNYSWQDTIDYACKKKINSIQFYVPQNYILPPKSDKVNFKNIYLHLPIDYDSKTEELIQFATNFKKIYNSNKLIIHQKESLSNQETKAVIEKYNHAGFLVGIENEATKKLDSFFELIYYLSKQNTEFFIIPDIHRFYFNFAVKYNEASVYKMIIKILDYCKKSEIEIVLHVIDSISYKSNRLDWVSLFNGIVPYSQLFIYISENHINIESLIFEYESYDSVTNSLDNFNKFDYNTGK